MWFLLIIEIYALGSHPWYAYHREMGAEELPLSLDSFVKRADLISTESQAAGIPHWGLQYLRTRNKL